jgi:glycine/D-amino acid oxidase-like deaminating enzyme
MTNFDWIVAGAGITGAALSYELARKGFSVLLLERHHTLQGATRFGYGGLAFWSGTTELTRQICAEGIELHRTLSEELAHSTQFRELDLVLPIAPDADPQAAAQAYAQFAIPPQLLSVQEACELEPLLNPAAIAGALTVKHGHIAPAATAQAYTQAFTRLGGTIQVGQATDLLRTNESRITGVVCGQETYTSANVAICAGALSRALLKAAGIRVRLYFTHAELIETPPVEIQMKSLVMPAETKRFQLEAASSQAELDELWDQPGHEPVPPILDAGAIQFIDGSLRIGQVSRTLTDPEAPIDPAQSEAEMRTQVGEILPALKNLPGTWHHCLIAFSSDRLPLIGPVPNVEGVHLFSGFSNPLVVVPTLARRFAANAANQPDEIIAQLSPARFG